MTVVHTVLTATKFVETVLMKVNVLTSMEHASLDAMLATRGTCVKQVSRKLSGQLVRYAAGS